MALLVGVPLVCLNLWLLGGGLAPGTRQPQPPWSVLAACVTFLLAVVVVIAVFSHRWMLATTISLVIAIPWVALILAGAIITLGSPLLLALLPAVLVWVPVFLICLRMPGREGAEWAKVAEVE